jgi:Polysaccharide pyruvyl transferase
MNARRPRVGLFGLLGAGNIGNDVSAFSVHPDLVWTIPVTREQPEDPKRVAVGVMAYYATTYQEVTGLLGPVAAVVATRLHNLIFALKLGKPTIALSYARKSEICREVEKVVAECSHAARAQPTGLSEVLFSGFSLPPMA